MADLRDNSNIFETLMEVHNETKKLKMEIDKLKADLKNYTNVDEISGEVKVKRPKTVIEVNRSLL